MKMFNVATELQVLVFTESVLYILSCLIDFKILKAFKLNSMNGQILGKGIFLNRHAHLLLKK